SLQSRHVRRFGPLVSTPHPRCARPLPARGEAEKHLLSSSGRDLTADPALARGEAEKRLPLPARGEGRGEGYFFSSLLLVSETLGRPLHWAAMSREPHISGRPDRRDDS